ncbi:MAG TPA: glycosyl transferase family protein [Bryobacteraceae bacterium]
MATSWIVAISVPVAVYLILSGIDDLVVDFLWWWHSIVHPACAPSSEDLDRTAPRRIAIFVPLWHEHQVIEQMLSHNLAAIEYPCYTIFAGVYPNDPATREAVERAAARMPDVRVCPVPHPGPTSKADCLNWIYQQMLVDEEQSGVRYELVITHDAEDIIHPQALRWINFYMNDADFVQIPVLALKTPLLALTHGIYCDEFAEMHTRDLSVRSAMGAFVPSAGVGTGYSRRALEALAEHDSNQIFIPGALTEDYENGLRLHHLGFRQKFVPILKSANGSFLATREYFPQSFWSSVRQRTRWVTGIALQSWARNGWCNDWKTRYWLWRDRKGLIGSPLGLVTNALFIAICCSKNWSGTSLPVSLRALFAATAALGVYRIMFRMGCVMRVYGGSMAAMAPVRIVWGNWINGLATIQAVGSYVSARVRGQALSWRKTAHEYPSRAALLGQSLRLGEILVQNRLLDRQTIEYALANKGEFLRLGEYLVRTGAITEQQMYEALGLQQQLPVIGAGPLSIPRKVARALPIHFIRDWKVIPFAIDNQGLHVCTPEPPPHQLHSQLARHTRLPVRFHLMPTSRFEALSAEVLDLRPLAGLSLAAGD